MFFHSEGAVEEEAEAEAEAEAEETAACFPASKVQSVPWVAKVATVRANSGVVSLRGLACGVAWLCAEAAEADDGGEGGGGDDLFRNVCVLWVTLLLRWWWG